MLLFKDENSISALCLGMKWRRDELFEMTNEKMVKKLKTIKNILVMLFSIAVVACGGGGGGTTGGGVGGSTITATSSTTAQSLTVGTEMASITPLTASGGTPPYSYSYLGTLPPGLSFSSSTGAVSGTPTNPYPTKSLFFTVKDANNITSSTTSFVLFSVGAAGPISASATTTAQYLKVVGTLTVGTPMTSFSPLTPSGGALPYTYSYTGTLPTGLSFNSSTGAVTGTPTASYPTASLVFSVKDANNVVAGTTSTVPFTVSSGTTTSASTFPFQNAARLLWANGIEKSMTLSGTCSGTGWWIETPATTAATFEGVAGYSATRTRYVVFANSSLAFCLPSLRTSVETRYYDQNYMLLGYNRIGGYYYVIPVPLNIPATVTVGGSDTIGSVYAYTNSTKTFMVQRIDMSYVIEADTSNSAIVNVKLKTYDLSNTLIYSEQDRYRITASGALTLVSGDAQDAGGFVNGVFN
jgi:hypothetical protein